MCLLTEEQEKELEELPSELWSTGKDGDIGLLRTATPVTIKPKSSYRPLVKQYPLKPEAEEGISEMIDSLIKQGVLVDCPDSPCNTPILPVKKATSGWRLVNDLQAVNRAVIPRAPNVPDPYTLLNNIKPTNVWYSVIDLTNAFVTIALSPESQFWFAFTFKHRRLTYSRLPQGFQDSPTIFPQEIKKCIDLFEPPEEESQILTYVDDILVTSSSQQKCKNMTLALLRYLAAAGVKVSKSKLQLWSQEVKYLGYTLTPEGHVLDEQRKTTILQLPQPTTKREMMSFLGTCNFCRLWIANYAEIAQPLQNMIYGKAMAASDKVVWTEEGEQAFTKLKQLIASSSVLEKGCHTNSGLQKWFYDICPVTGVWG